MNNSKTTAARTQNPKSNGNGCGSIFKTPDNKWKGSFVIGYHPETGKPVRKTKTAKTKRAVQDWQDEMKLQYGKGPKGIVNVSKVLFDDIANEYFTMCVKDAEAGNCSSHTVSQRKGIYDKHIAPKFAHLKLSTITEEMLKSFLTSLRDDNGLTRTHQIAKTIFVQIYQLAVDKKYCQTNLARTVHLDPKTKAQKNKQLIKKHKRAISPEDQERILAAAKPYPLISTVINIMLNAGLRIGEVLALRWDSINFRESKIYVTQALVKKATFGDGNRVIGSHTEIGSPKTASSWRELGMGEKLKACIRAWQDYLISTGVPAETLTGSTLVFLTRNGTHYTEDGFRSIFKRFYDKQKEQNKITTPDLCHHSFRHAFAANLLNAGKPLSDIQKALGHNDVETTFKYLGCDIKTDMVKLANDLENFCDIRAKDIDAYRVNCSSF